MQETVSVEDTEPSDYSWNKPVESQFFALELSIFLLTKGNDLLENPQQILKYLDPNNNSKPNYPLNDVINILFKQQNYISCFSYSTETSNLCPDNNPIKTDLDPLFKEEAKNFFDDENQFLEFNLYAQTENANLMQKPLDREQFFMLLSEISNTRKELLEECNFSLKVVNNYENFINKCKDIQKLNGSLLFNVEED